MGIDRVGVISRAVATTVMGTAFERRSISCMNLGRITGMSVHRWGHPRAADRHRRQTCETWIQSRQVVALAREYIMTTVDSWINSSAARCRNTLQSISGGSVSAGDAGIGDGPTSLRAICQTHANRGKGRLCAQLGPAQLQSEYSYCRWCRLYVSRVNSLFCPPNCLVRIPSRHFGDKKVRAGHNCFLV